MSHVAIVGAGLGGLRAAESLRANGYTGSITVIGNEPHMPYNRPPLSKEALKSGVDIDSLEFRRKGSVDDVTWHLGSAVSHCDLSAGQLTLADDTVIAFDGLVAASGIRPRDFNIPGPRTGRFFLRDAADAARLREQLTPGRRIVILGSGFIGCEVAATARTLGCEVDVISLDPVPMMRPLGRDLGAGMQEHHVNHAVRFHLGHSIATFTGDDAVSGAVLDDDSAIEADVVLEAVGSVPNVEWLDGNGLDLSDGILCEPSMRVVGSDIPFVAVGDVARYENALFPGAARRIEHWNLPTETGKRAGATLAALLAGADVDSSPFSPMPSFWSDQYEHKIQSFGLPGIADEIVIAAGEPTAECVAEYRRDGRLVGVVGINSTSALVPYRAALMAG